MHDPQDPTELRRYMKKVRMDLSISDREKIFQHILNHLLHSDPYIRAKTIVAYYGKTESGEFDTRPLLTQILLDKKNLLLPRVNSLKSGLDLYFIQNIVQDLEKGSFNIMEPKKTHKICSDFKVIDLVIVPGLVFDIFGNRYGYGKGYYDRLLESFQSFGIMKIALAYSKTILSTELKHNTWDIPMDIIVTEFSFMNPQST